MAFQYWRQKADPEPRRTRFLALGDAYHGDTLGDVSVGGVEPVPRDVRARSCSRPSGAPSPHCYRCPLGLERPDVRRRPAWARSNGCWRRTRARSRPWSSSRWCRGRRG